jgi:outer membrane protein assembly factor BamB
MYRGDITHNGNYLKEELASSKLSLAWSHPSLNKGIHTASKSSPVIDDKAVYVGSDDGYLYAFNKDTGHILWKFKVGKCKYGIHSSPAVDKRNVYVGAYDSYLYALYKDNGKVKWKTSLGDFIGASPTLFENKIYIAAETRKPGGFLATVNRYTGKLIFRSKELGGHSHSTPTISSELRIAYLGANSDYVFAFDADTGKTIWEYKTKNNVKSTPALTKELVLFTSWDRHMYAFTNKKGKLKWIFKSKNKMMSSPSVDEETNMVYVGSHDKHCYAVDLNTGKEIWAFKTRGAIISSPIIVKLKEPGIKAVIIGSYGNRVYILNAKTGKMLNCLSLNDRVTSVPVVKDGVLYVSSNKDFYVFK